MGNTKLDSSKEPIRIFKSSILEFFTHISPVTILVIWMPIIGFCIYSFLVVSADRLLILPIGIFSGLLLWTPAEYLLHRFLFHFPPKNPRQERISFLIHGVHHQQPRVKTRLLMPPPVSIPLALFFYVFFWVIFGIGLNSPAWALSLFSGFLLGYVFYDLTHYALHHIKIRKGYFLVIRQHHMHHHFQTPGQRFGVTNVFWDKVFNTLPE